MLQNEQHIRGFLAGVKEDPVKRVTLKSVRPGETAKSELGAAPFSLRSAPSTFGAAPFSLRPVSSDGATDVPELMIDPDTEDDSKTSIAPMISKTAKTRES